MDFDRLRWGRSRLAEREPDLGTVGERHFDQEAGVISRVHELFGEALDHPEDGRLDWLRRQCAGDERTYAAVLRLLQADQVASVLDGDLAALAQPLITQRLENSPDASVQHLGARFGPYVVLQLLGRGGMGSVWLAERTEGEFQQQVAIKLLAGALPSPEALQRFAQERQILARLSHPNIARVLDGGSVDGAPWFAMDFVQGLALDEFALARQLSLEQRLLLFGKVVAAVQFAHQNLVVHRDLKPSNILVEANGEPKLLDFGIAKLLDAGSALTASSAPLSMAYAAPEQIAGLPVTTATDLYSLGVILYELLTGTRPHKSRGNGSLALLQAITDTDPPPPSRAVAGATTRESRRLRGDLDTIVLKCLSRDPTRRYASAQALLDDLDCYLRQLPIRARPESWRYRGGKFIRRNPFGVALSVLATVALLGLTLFSTLKAQEAERERLSATAQAERATAVQDFMVGLFEQQRPDSSLGASISAKDLLDRAELTLERETALGGAARAALLQTLVGLRYELGDYVAALRLGEQWVTLAAQQDGETSVAYAQALVSRSFSLQQLGRSAEAVTDCQNALPLLRLPSAAVGVRFQGLLDCSAVLRVEDQLDAAAELLQQAAALVDQMPGSAARDLKSRQALQAFSQGDHRRAVALNTELIETLRQDPAAPPSELAEALHSRATSQRRLGATQAAIADYRAALEQHQRVLGGSHDLTIQTRTALAALLSDDGQREEGRALGEQALREARDYYGPDSPMLAILLNSAALQAVQRLDLQAPEPLLQEAIAINSRAYGKSHGNTLAMLNSLSSVQRKRGHYDDARASANEVLGRVSSDPRHSFHARQAHARLASIADAVGDAVEQATQARWILAALEVAGASEVDELHDALTQLALAQLRLGRLDEARASADRLEAAARADFAAGTGLRSSFIAYVAWIEFESGDLQRALVLSTEALGSAPVAAASWNRSSMAIAAIVHFRVLSALGRSAEAAPWELALCERQKLAPADETPYWRTLQAGRYRCGDAASLPKVSP